MSIAKYFDAGYAAASLRDKHPFPWTIEEEREWLDGDTGTVYFVNDSTGEAVAKLWTKPDAEAFIALGKLAED